MFAICYFPTFYDGNSFSKILGNTLWSLQKKVQGNKSSAQAKTWVTCFAICPFPQHEHFVLLGDSKGNISLLEVNAQTGSSTIGERKQIFTQFSHLP